MREVHELINVDDPAWPLLLQELSGTDVPVEVVPGDAGIGRAVLLQLQVSARSNLGGIVLNCGGLLVDGGWLRIFGSPAGADAEGLPGLAEINAMPAAFDPGWTFPPLWSAEARRDLPATSRRAVPMAELLSLSRASCRQFDGVDPGFLGVA